LFQRALTDEVDSWRRPVLLTAVCFLGGMLLSFFGALERDGKGGRLKVKPPCAVSSIAVHNSGVGTVGAFAPLTLGAGSVIVAATTGILVGTVLATPLVYDVRAAWVAKVIAPHGLIEVPMLLFLSASGFRLLRVTIGRDREAFREVLWFNLLATAASIPLFFLAAAIECRPM
jgi:uncharacterized membrane protein SpoIIM required for sporulation